MKKWEKEVLEEKKGFLFCVFLICCCLLLFSLNPHGGTWRALKWVACDLGAFPFQMASPSAILSE